MGECGVGGDVPAAACGRGIGVDDDEAVLVGELGVLGAAVGFRLGEVEDSEALILTCSTLGLWSKTCIRRGDTWRDIVRALTGTSAIVDSYDDRRLGCELVWLVNVETGAGRIAAEVGGDLG